MQGEQTHRRPPTMSGIHPERVPSNLSTCCHPRPLQQTGRNRPLPFIVPEGQFHAMLPATFSPRDTGRLQGSQDHKIRIPFNPDTGSINVVASARSNAAAPSSSSARRPPFPSTLLVHDLCRSLHIGGATPRDHRLSTPTPRQRAYSLQLSRDHVCIPGKPSNRTGQRLICECKNVPTGLLLLGSHGSWLNHRYR